MVTLEKGCHGFPCKTMKQRREMRLCATFRDGLLDVWPFFLYTDQRKYNYRTVEELKDNKGKLFQSTKREVKHNRENM